jgi:general secretion pathway protein A
VVHERLEPLNRGQVADYVAYRLKRAGGRGIQLSASGCKLLHKASQGIPRLINRIMDRTLLLASLDATRSVSKRHVQTAITTMKDIKATRKKNKAMAVPLVLGTFFVVAALIYFFVFNKPKGVIPGLTTSIPSTIQAKVQLKYSTICYDSMTDNYVFFLPIQGTAS